MQPDTETFHSTPIALMTRREAVNTVLRAAISGPPMTFRFVNAGTFQAAHVDSGYKAVLAGGGINFPDGKPLALLLRLVAPRHKAAEQIRGPWMFETCVDEGRSAGVRHFLLGATAETLRLAEAELSTRFPGAQFVGSYAPPFGVRRDEEIETADELVRRSGANMVWVALGTPKQDREAQRITAVTGTCTAAIGAAIDFSAGTKRPAPVWMQGLYIEWLFRLATEPKRLWRRYLLGNALFIYLAIDHLAQKWRKP